MARFNRIIEVNPEGRYARVQPGVRNLAISQAAAPHGLYYAPDPSSQIACSIGGNVAENAGGVHCLKYGLTVHNLLKVEILTIEGEYMTLGSDALDAPGFDLLALFTGSEGMLGIVTEVTVKLLPKPQVARVLLASFDSVEKAGAQLATSSPPASSPGAGDDGQPVYPRHGGLHSRRLPRGRCCHPVVRARRRRVRRAGGLRMRRGSASGCGRDRRASGLR
jgi:glycolate oxidase